jgi:RNA polymerase sigma-70 factor (ECF subfamily)
LRRDEAIARLYALLLREARFEVKRRTVFVAHPSGVDLDDLAVQAADDAVVAVLAKLRQFRGDSLFTTWACRFAQTEAPATIRRRRGRNGDLPMNLDFERSLMWHGPDDSPHERTVAKETARTLAHLIANELTARQRAVLVARVIDDESTAELAHRLETTTGAVYKTLHDARRKLKAHLGEEPAQGAQAGVGSIEAVLRQLRRDNRRRGAREAHPLTSEAAAGAHGAPAGLVTPPSPGRR